MDMVLGMRGSCVLLVLACIGIPRIGITCLFPTAHDLLLLTSDLQLIVFLCSDDLVD